MLFGEITKLYTLDQNHDNTKNFPTGQKTTRPRTVNSPSTLASKASPLTSANGKAKAPSPKGDSRSIFRKKPENNRRHSIAVSPMREDETLASSPAFGSHTPTSKVSKTKSKVQSPSGVQRNGTLEKGASVSSAKKRLSFLSSAASSRRHYVPTKVGMVSNKNNVAPIPEEKP